MPAKFGDLSKKGDDLFNKGFELGKYKLEVENKTAEVELTTKGHVDNASKMASSHDLKFNCPKFGSLKVSHTGAPGFGVEIENSKLIKGGKITACLHQNTSGCALPDFKNLKVAWGNSQLNVNASTNLKALNLDAVVNYSGYNLGAKVGLNKSGAVSDKQIAWNFNKGSIDYTIRTSFENDYAMMMHNSVAPGKAMAVNLVKNSTGVNFGVAGKIAGACGSHNQFKVNNAGLLTLSHVTPLAVSACSATLTMSAEMNVTQLQAGAHKMGAGVKFNL